MDETSSKPKINWKTIALISLKIIWKMLKLLFGLIDLFIPVLSAFRATKREVSEANNPTEEGRARRAAEADQFSREKHEREELRRRREDIDRQAKRDLERKREDEKTRKVLEDIAKKAGKK